MKNHKFSSSKKRGLQVGSPWSFRTSQRKLITETSKSSISSTLPSRLGITFYNLRNPNTGEPSFRKSTSINFRRKNITWRSIVTRITKAFLRSCIRARIWSCKTPFLTMETLLSQQRRNQRVTHLSSICSLWTQEVFLVPINSKSVHLLSLSTTRLSTLPRAFWVPNLAKEKEWW